MLQCSSVIGVGGEGGGGLLSLGPFSHKICQGLGLDRRLGHASYIDPHELECLLGDPSRGNMVLHNFSKPK
jgi:hypothetical protein